jgi:geranylgeranyl diphosphate synthase type II
MAVNVGDALHCKMWEMLNQNVSLLGYELSFKILSEFIQLSNRVVEGQHIELSWMQEKRWDVSDEDYWMMCVQKTAWYTCITPCRLGALISGSVQPDQLEQFIHIGTDLGVAFQIQDDVLNLIGEEGVYGKEIAGDISEGKRTLMLIHLFRSCTESESEILASIMDKQRQEKTEVEVFDVLNLMKKYNSIQYAEQKSKQFAKQASDKFDQVSGILPGEEAKQIFKSLIDFVIERQY